MNRVLHSIGDMVSLLNGKNRTSNRSVEPVAYCRHQLFEINKFKSQKLVFLTVAIVNYNCSGTKVSEHNSDLRQLLLVNRFYFERNLMES